MISTFTIFILLLAAAASLVASRLPSVARIGDDGVAVESVGAISLVITGLTFAMFAVTAILMNMGVDLDPYRNGEVFPFWLVSR